MSFPDTNQVRTLIKLALEEDQAFSDVTAKCTIDSALKGRAVLHCKEELVVCGLPIIEIIAQQFACELKVELLQQEGARVDVKSELAHVNGSVRALLALERTILNFLQRLCGVATYTNNFVRNACGIEILDTRKTIPGWRQLDKYATRVGGARNHRADLKSMALVKNNHIDANLGDIAAVLAALSGCGVPVEVEVRDTRELAAVLKRQVDYVMLDNMSNQQISESLEMVKQLKPSVLVEVSGGVTPERLPELAQLGVKLVSVGALTTQARNVDISMSIKIDR